MNNQLEKIKKQCQKYMNKQVKVQVQGGQEYKGLIEHVDDQYVYLTVPVDEYGNYMNIDIPSSSEQMRDGRRPYPQQNPYYYGPQQPYPNPYPYPYQPYPPYYPPYYQQPFTWGQLILPLTALTALATII